MPMDLSSSLVNFGGLCGCDRIGFKQVDCFHSPEAIDFNQCLWIFHLQWPTSPGTVVMIGLGSWSCGLESMPMDLSSSLVNFGGYCGYYPIGLIEVDW